jgi:hypothetical protein
MVHAFEYESIWCKAAGTAALTFQSFLIKSLGRMKTS